MEQEIIPFRKTKKDISDEAILRCKTLMGAIRLMIETSGLATNDVAFRLGINEKHLSRMLFDNGEDKRHFSLDLLNKMMDYCGNEIPLRWLALSRGYGLYQRGKGLMTELDLLRKEISELRANQERMQETLNMITAPMKADLDREWLEAVKLHAAGYPEALRAYRKKERAMEKAGIMKGAI